METEKQPGKLLMLKGLPRSGKSTWANEFILKAGNWYRVNKDSLRPMLHAGKWTPRNEKITMKAQDAIVRTLLAAGQNVIVDDTNLGKYHHDRWSGIAKEVGARFETKEFKEDIQTLVERDGNAEEQRGRHVIEKMALQYDYIKFAPDSLIICDIDGTIADCEHRRHHLAGETKDWTSFFEEMNKDTLIESTRDMLFNYHKQGKQIMFVSARPDKYREMTEDWLFTHGFAPLRSIAYCVLDEVAIPYEALLMRNDNDTRNDTIVKQEILDTYLDLKAIHVVIDDRPSVLRMWEENGLKTIDVGKGEEF